MSSMRQRKLVVSAKQSAEPVNLICVLCGGAWLSFMNVCKCGGFCTWGKYKGGNPSSWKRVTSEDGREGYIPRAVPNIHRGY